MSTLISIPKPGDLYDLAAPTHMNSVVSDSIGPNSAPPGRGDSIRLLVLTEGLENTITGSMSGELITRLNVTRFKASLCSLQALGPVGTDLARSIPTTSHVLRHRLDLPAVTRLARQLRGQVDVVLTVGPGAPMTWGSLAARWGQVPVVMSMLSSLDRPTSLTLGNQLVLRWSDALIADCEQKRQQIIGGNRRNTPIIHVIPPGIDTQRYVFQPSGAFATRRQLQVPEGAPLCGLMSTDWSDRSLRRLFDVIRQIRFKHESARFVLFGPSASQLVLSRRVHQAGLDAWAKTIEASDDLPRVLSALSVVCSVGEPTQPPIPLWQAMSVQVPVVTVRSNDRAALDLDDGGAPVVIADNTRELAGRVVGLIRDPQQARELGERGRRFVCEHRAFDVMVRRYERLMIGTFHRKRSGPGTPLPDTLEFCGATP